jgi:copper chaperone CopZ
VLSGPVTLSIDQAPLRVHGCELCSAGPKPLQATVLVRYLHGGVVQFAACAHCASAIRRVISVVGGDNANGPIHLAVEVDDSASASSQGKFVNVVGEPVVLHEHADVFQAEDDRSYLVRIYGQGRADSTWIGWLSFVATDGRGSRTTGEETSQLSRHHTAYWAMGLEPAYFTSAFRRSA